MRCPSCKKDMLGVEFKGVEIDCCETCGVWLDEGELEILLSGEEEEAFVEWKETGREPDLPCPACFDGMRKVRLTPSSPVIDACPWQHGLWFEKGELAEVLSEHLPDGETGDLRAVQVLDFLRNLFSRSQGSPGEVGEESGKERA